jgi:hypothetical protein
MSRLAGALSLSMHRLDRVAAFSKASRDATNKPRLNGDGTQVG